MQKFVLKLFAICAILWLVGYLAILLRTIFWGREYYDFLNWNLFLAWVPAVLALLVYRLDHSKIHHRLATPFFFFLWLIFYPNAPYVITDFKHLIPRPPVPISYDFLLIFSYSLLAILLGYISLHLIHQTLGKYIKNKFILWPLITLHFPVIAFGVYVGRYLRWYSWDIFTHPIGLLHELFGTV
ncbi:MAG: DUF1361 domain-containing protein, partial [Patescibacteria group bacterium]